MKVKKLRPETKTNLKKAVKNVQKVLKVSISYRLKI